MSEYEMPVVTLGEWVLFYPHQGSEPSVGLVTKASSRTVTLWVIAAGIGGMERPSVHHLTDPGVEQFQDWKRYGFWEARPRDPKLAVLAEKVALLERKLEALEPKKPR